MNCIRTNAQNPDFIELVKALDKDLAITDGDEHAFYDQFNKLDTIKYVVLAYNNGKVVACGAIKQYDEQTMEVKRMYTIPAARGKGVASDIIQALEIWTQELHFQRCILETGTRQHAAIRLYQKNNYQVIENYGQYEGMENSICFEKRFQ